jgi:hypothetical protein
MVGYRFWPEPLLQAQLEFQNFRLPARFELDPAEISDELSRELSMRAQQDFAIRTLLGTDGQNKVADLVVPRLLNASVIRRLIEGVDALSTVISVSQYNGLVIGQIENSSDRPMEDVALILPGAADAEGVDGQRFTISEPGPDLKSIQFGTIEPGQTLHFNVWFNDVPDSASTAFADHVRLGASEGIDGNVSIYGQQDWFGQSLEVVSWARWTVAAILALAFVGSFAALGYQAVGLLRPMRRQ